MKKTAVLSLFILSLLFACSKHHKNDGGAKSENAPARPNLEQARNDLESAATQSPIILDVYRDGFSSDNEGDLLSTTLDLDDRNDEGSVTLDSNGALKLNNFVTSANPGLSLVMNRSASVRSHIQKYSYRILYKNASAESFQLDHFHSEALEVLDFKDSQWDVRMSGKGIQKDLQDLKAAGFTPTELYVFIDSDLKSSKGDWNASLCHFRLILE